MGIKKKPEEAQLINKGIRKGFTKNKDKGEDIGIERQCVKREKACKRKLMEREKIRALRSALK